MADYDNRILRGAATAGTVDTGLRAYMLKVYNYMAGALALTGVVAYGVVQSGLINQFFQTVMTTNGVTLQPTILGWVVMLAPLAMVFFLSFRIHKMSFAAAQTTFWVYAALMGVSLATILFLYTGSSIALTFFVTAATFGAMSVWGYTTGRDLTGFGSFLFMGLIGIPLPGVEIGIALSALLLGAMVCGEIRPKLIVAAILVGAFGLFHGHAHGTELPPGQNGLLYSLGFVIATGTLHAVGIALGLVHRWPAGKLAIRVAGAAISVLGAVFLWQAIR